MNIVSPVQGLDQYTRNNYRDKSLGKTPDSTKISGFQTKGTQEKIVKSQVTRTPIKTPRDKLIKAYIESKPSNPKPTPRCASTRSMKPRQDINLDSSVTPRSESMY